MDDPQTGLRQAERALPQVVERREEACLRAIMGLPDPPPAPAPPSKGYILINVCFWCDQTAPEGQSVVHRPDCRYSSQHEPVSIERIQP